MSLAVCLAKRPSSLMSLVQRMAACSRWSVPRYRSSAGSVEPSESVPFVTTGVHQARFPQQEMLEIHRRNAKLEDAKYERRRRIGLVKIVIGIGMLICSYMSVILFHIWWNQCEDYAP